MPKGSFSVDSLALEADELVRRMYNHILKDGCIHCKHILQNNNEAGNQPAPTTSYPHYNPSPEANQTRSVMKIK